MTMSAPVSFLYGVTISDINRGTEGYSARNIQFASNEYSITVRLRPKLIISYKDMKGIEDYWTTTSQNAGIAGSGHVNNATGFEADIQTLRGIREPSVWCETVQGVCCSPQSFCREAGETCFNIKSFPALASNASPR